MPKFKKSESDISSRRSQPPALRPRLPAPILPSQPNLPCLDLLQGDREEYIKFGVPLFEASLKGNWDAAKAILDERPVFVRFAITENYDTTLHIVASAKNSKCTREFVNNLVNLMREEDLHLQNRNYDTAISLTAAAGNVEMAKIILQKNPTLLDIPDSKGMMPLYKAALYAKPHMVRHIYNYPDARKRKMSGHLWTTRNRGWVLQKCVEADVYDVAMRIMNDYPELYQDKRLLGDVLLVLAEKPQAFEGIKQPILLRIIKSIFRVKVGPAEVDSQALQLLKTIWRQVAKMPKGEIDDILRGPSVPDDKTADTTTVTLMYPSRVLFHAAKKGNTRFIIELFRLYPDILWKLDDRGRTIFHIAVKRRHAEIYNLLYEIGGMKDIITPISDNKGNNMLHLVATGYKPTRLRNVSGAALQMQHELLWFKEVHQMILPTEYHRENEDGIKPTHELFAKTHADLVTKGEEWMKYTASQCMVVATLISTIVFAAAFTLPGSYNQNTGFPFFRDKPPLIVFVISDAISLIFSSTSILMFLSILTSRYAEHDFLESLPRKLMLGLAMLFLSIMTMMVAFSASFFVLYTPTPPTAMVAQNKNLKWVPVLITGLGGLPVVLFAILQFRLLRDVFYSTYQSRHLFKPKKSILYVINLGAQSHADL